MKARPTYTALPRLGRLLFAGFIVDGLLVLLLAGCATPPPPGASPSASLQHSSYIRD